MNRRKVKSIAIVSALALAGAGIAVLVPAALFLYVLSSASTRRVNLHVEGTVHQRDTGQPVPDCRLTFVEDHIGYTPSDDGNRSDARTDAAGRADYAATYDGSGFFPFARLDPKMRIYIGAAPRYGPRDDVETWEVTLRFRGPWRSGSEVTRVPHIEIQRFMGHDGGLDPLPTGAGDAKVEARVHIGQDGNVPVYRIPLDLYLNPAQVAACQAQPRP